MGESAPPDPDESAFRELLAPGIRDLRAQRGACPSSEELVAFHEGRMRVEQAAQVRHHIEACGLCDVQLERLEGADATLSLSLPERIWIFLRNPIVPYALVALLLVPAYRDLVRSAKNSRERPKANADPNFDSEIGAAAVPNFSLDAVRSESGAQKSSLIRLASENRLFLLSFFIPMQSSALYRYEVVAVGEHKRTVVPPHTLKNCDGIGNCVLVCNAALFPPAPYELRLTETAPVGEKTITFPFQTSR